MRTIVLAALVGLFPVAPPAQAQQSGGGPESYRDCAKCPEMIRIPPGSFMMGAAPGEHQRENVLYPEREVPQHNVTIGHGFSLGKYEVTLAEFGFFVESTGYKAEGDWRSADVSKTTRDPVGNIGWNDAKAYVAWLSQTTGKRYRLPSEAEWEYAARAGTTTARYWGDRHQDACRYGNVGDASHGCSDGYDNHMAPVGKFQPNAFGLHDMLGNVWEWTEDCWNDNYMGAPVDGSSWQGGNCTRRVLRGGSFISDPRELRVSMRFRFAIESMTVSRYGFRVARSD